jgi:ribosomal protein S18 acetylase RimI-like enzyme
MGGDYWRSASLQLQVVEDSEWDVVRWLWQLFRYDLADVTDAFPYSDGRYQARLLDATPPPDLVGYIVWRPHPKTDERSPVAFALVDGIAGDRRSVAGFWVLPQLRRSGVGRQLALEVLRSHPAPWLIGFQHENTSAGSFWRSVADEAFGPKQWREHRSPIAARPDEPPDHHITSPA